MGRGPRSAYIYDEYLLSTRSYIFINETASDILAGVLAAQFERDLWASLPSHLTHTHTSIYYL